MNSKTKRLRKWKAEFRRKYQQRLHQTVEAECGISAQYLCVFIAKMAEDLSGGRLKSRSGLLLISDAGRDEAPLITAHCWNLLDGQVFDLSPWGNCPHPVEYVTEDDGEQYAYYSQQGVLFGEVSEDDLQADIESLMHAFRTYGDCQPAGC